MEEYLTVSELSGQKNTESLCNLISKQTSEVGEHWLWL